MIVGIYSGALTSTPAFSAAKATADTQYESDVTVGHGTAYLFSVIGVVLYVQFVPKIVGANMEIEKV
jgi:putative transport protein